MENFDHWHFVLAGVSVILFFLYRSKAQEADINSNRYYKIANEVSEIKKNAKTEVANAKAEVELALKSRALYEEHSNKIVALYQQRAHFFPILLEAKLQMFDRDTKAALNMFKWGKYGPNKSAQNVSLVRKEAREQKKLMHLLEFRLRYLESLFPWLADFTDEDITSLLLEKEQQSGEISESDVEDPILKNNLITKPEYQKLSPPQRNQLALDRWLRNRNKSAWQVGREFERYYGYFLENKGFDVTYYGATEALEDLGRDLIAEKGKETFIIQCKYWAKHKTIHEKHIYQLYGSFCDYKIDKNIRPGKKQGELFAGDTVFKDIKAKFVSTTKLSDRAQKAANMLNVEVELIEEMNFDYPRIKCNIGKDGEKIYHLPFDQQYDKVKIEKHKGEFYAKTCQEAEDAGFRRAWRWKPS